MLCKKTVENVQGRNKVCVLGVRVAQRLGFPYLYKLGNGVERP